jgi:hypothetical protein
MQNCDFPLVLYGCETRYLRLREELELRMFEDSLRIFQPRRDEGTESWRKLHNEELHNSCSLLSIIKMIKSRMKRWVRDVARMGRIEVHVGY